MSSKIKIDGQDGKFGFVTKGAELDNASAAYAGGFAQITAKGAASYFDTLKDDTIEGGEALEVGDIVYLPSWSEAGSVLTAGDTCVPLTVDFDGSSWVTDRGRSASRDLADNTSQGDIAASKRSFREGGLQNDTGSISGYYADGAAIQREIDSHFTIRIIDDGTKKTKVPVKSGSFLTAFCYRETSTVGETEIWIFREMYIQSIDDTGSPMNGNVPFNFSYTTSWKRQYERTIAA